MQADKNHAKNAFFPLILFSMVILFPVSLAAQRAALASLEVAAAPVWSQPLGDVVLGRPYLQAESAVVAESRGTISSFYMTGTALWTFDPQVPVAPFLARSYEGAVYLSDNSGVFRAINRVSRELWRVDLGAPISFSPVVGWDGRVFIPVQSQLFCRTAAGHSLWSIDLTSPVAIAPALDRAGNLVSVLENRDFVRVSPFSAVERIRLDQMPMLIASMKEGNDDVYVMLYPNGSAEKITHNAGAARGNRLSRGSFPSLPAAPASAAAAVLSAGGGNTFAVTLRDGRVLLIDVAGRTLWTGDSHEASQERGSGNLSSDQAAMVFDERGIYSISTRGTTGFAPDGRRRFIHRFPEASSIPAFSDEGILYVCGTDRQLYAFRIDSRTRTVPRSRFYGPDPEGSYGLGNPPPSPWANDSDRFMEFQQTRMHAMIESAINSGQIGENEPAYVAYLMEMIGFFLNDPHYSRVRPRVMPTQQIEYIRLLGRMGSRESVPYFWTIFDRIEEPAVKAASAEAIGSIGVDPNGNTFVAFSFYLAANNPNRDLQLLMSATSTIAALCRFSGPPLSGEGIVLLRYFSNLTWAPNVIRTQIRNELEALFREGLDRVIQ